MPLSGVFAVRKCCVLMPTETTYQPAELTMHAKGSYFRLNITPSFNQDFFTRRTTITPHNFGRCMIL